MSVVHIIGTNRQATRRAHSLRWTIDLPIDPNFIKNTYNVQLHSISFSNTFPVITKDYNDKLYFTYNGIDNFITLEDGNYNVYTLLESLQTGLQVLNPGFTLEYQEDQKKLVLNVPNGVTFSLRRPITTELIDDFSCQNGIDRLLEILGWQFFKQTSSSLTGTYIPENCVRVISTEWVGVAVTLPVRSSFNLASGHNLIGKAYIGLDSFGNISTTVSTQDIFYPVDLSGVNDFDMYFFDDHGILLQPSEFCTEFFISYRLSFLSTSH